MLPKPKSTNSKLYICKICGHTILWHSQNNRWIPLNAAGYDHRIECKDISQAQGQDIVQVLDQRRAIIGRRRFTDSDRERLELQRRSGAKV